MKLNDRVAVVTGGGSGIGKTLVERFCAEGARHLVVVDRDASAARAVADAVGGTSAALDVADESAIRELTLKVESDVGPIDLFVSNAGYVTIGGLEAPIEDLQRMFEVHVLAHVYAARAVLPSMIARGGGYLLNTASAAGLLTQFGSLHYALTKRAAIALAEWIAITHGHQGIAVSVLCPQGVETNILSNSPNAGAALEGVANSAGADGMLQPSAVAEAVIEALAEERFWVLPHPEVATYARQKHHDVDRWLEGMRRWQHRMFEGGTHPGEWLLP